MKDLFQKSKLAKGWKSHTRALKKSGCPTITLPQFLVRPSASPMRAANLSQFP